MDPFNLPPFGPLRWEYFSQFDLEQWYSSLSDVTCPSCWIPLSIPTAHALRAAYRHRYYQAAPPSVGEHALLTALEDHLTTLLKEHEWSSSFVRLSSRSPKDVGLDRAVIHMRNNPSSSSSSSSSSTGLGEIPPYDLNLTSQTLLQLNDTTRALLKYCGATLQISSGKEALELLTSSERIFRDLITAEDAVTPEHPWRMNVILRKWVDVDPESEWRCFAAHGQLVAASQYNDLLFYPHFVQDPSFVPDSLLRIHQLFQQISPRIAHPYYVIDFAVAASGVWIIELNPAGPVTGASLFNWEADRQILTGNRAPELAPMTLSYIEQVIIHDVVVRYRKLPSEGLKSQLELYIESVESTPIISPQPSTHSHSSFHCLLL